VGVSVGQGRVAKTTVFGGHHNENDLPQGQAAHSVHGHRRFRLYRITSLSDSGLTAKGGGCLPPHPRKYFQNRNQLSVPHCLLSIA